MSMQSLHNSSLRKITASVSFILMLLIMVTSMAAGATIDTYNNFVGSSDALANANMLYNGGTSSFTCFSTQQIVNPSVSVGTIGFSYWACSVVQDNQYEWEVYPSPSVNYSSSFHSWSDNSGIVYDIPGESTLGTSEGWHDFKNGSNSWGPYNYNQYFRP